MTSTIAGTTARTCCGGTDGNKFRSVLEHVVERLHQTDQILVDAGLVHMGLDVRTDPFGAEADLVAE